MKKFILIISAVLMLSSTAMNARTVTVTNNDPGKFTGIDVGFVFNVEFVPGDKYSVSCDVEADYENYLYTKVVNGILVVKFNNLPKKMEIFNNSKNFRCVVTAPFLNQINLGGSSSFVCNQLVPCSMQEFSLNTGGSSKVIKLEVDALKIGLNCGGSSSVNLAGKYAKCELDLGGTSKAYLMVDAAELEAEIGGTSKLEATGEFTSVEIEAAGTSKVTAKGKCDDMELYLSGTASVNTLEMPANDIKIEASGASRAKVNVEKSIKASLGGASGVSYMADSDIEMHPEVSKGASFKRIQ